MMITLSSIQPLKLVAISGSTSTPSRTEALIENIVVRVQQHIHVEVEFIRLSEIGHLIHGASRRDLLAPEVQQVLQTIEQADALIVGSPVYRASYTGLFKHLFDYVDQFALVDKPILLSATGGSERHALMIEHQLRPLFGFFQANALPIGVFATDKDFVNYQIQDQLVLDRIDLAVARAIPQFLFASTLNLNNSSDQTDGIKLNQILTSQPHATFLKHIEDFARHTQLQ